VSGGSARPSGGSARRSGGSARVTGVVLAGGRSMRFGRNKLAEPMADGSTILAHAVAAAALVCREVVVVIAPDAPVPAGLPANARVVVDPESFGGPLVGLAAGLARVSDEVVLVAGGDMPDLVPSVLARLAQVLADGSAGAVRLADRDQAAALPCAVRREPALRAAESALGAGDRRLRGLFERLVVELVPEADWRILDPAARTLGDIDRPEDLLAEAVRPNDEYGD
jgi:molybdopterin-guanine dinucleotide biosynthesis protein A